ncbi:diaminopimelate epimerase [Dermabacteraceae bacterium P13147]
MSHKNYADWPMALGHGTENDFVLVDDPQGKLEIAAEDVRFLCDRRAGLGGDGLIRLVPTARMPRELQELNTLPDGSLPVWFMDYRNADGSLAEMCGNGVRVFARELQRRGHEERSNFTIGTRAGIKSVSVLPDGQISVNMHRYYLLDEVSVRVAGEELPARNVDMGNPHTVTLLDPQVDLHALDLSDQPQVTPVPEHGTNAEFVQVVAPAHARMRVIERGAGETRSCGTGACAAIVALVHSLRAKGENPPEEWLLDVPGGSVTVSLRGDEVVLTGPAVIVAEVNAL